ncbi:MAG TPA: transcriptional repressor LexA [bacterium]|nr:transcriptional repressor LexA [bacterium]
MGGKKLDFDYILYRIRRFYLANKRMPSYSELEGLLHYQSKGAVRYVVEQLIDHQFIERDDKGKLLPKNMWNGYPLLGSVQAGFPSPAEEELLDTISLDSFLVEHKESTYLIRVTGDSMIEAGILPEDIVIVDRKRQPKNNDVVVAEVDKEWTLKYLEKKGKKIRLLPANSKYPPIEPKEELKIGGVVTGVVRKY